jgi:hypothetical protein
MPRIQGLRPDGVEGRVAEVFAEQETMWGAPLLPYQIYARRPSILHSVRAMWVGLAESGLIDGKLNALVNRRVAALNGCVF